MTSPIRVLFVDDDPNILRALRRSLRSHRGELDMLFAQGGAAALETLAQEPADVVVSDMRMPEMDGSTLLAEVRDRWPGTIRIILSGFSDEELVLRTVGPAHQFLTKPTDAATLVGAIHRATRLRRRLYTPELARTVARVDTLPSPPGIYLELVAALSDTFSDNGAISHIIESDTAMRAATLKLVNSAFFGLSEPVGTVSRAVQLLGFDTIRALAVGVGLYRTTEIGGVLARETAKLSQRGLLLGQMAAAIAKQMQLPTGQIELAMSAGFLAEVGTLLMLSELTGDLLAARETAQCRHMPLVEAERRHCGAAHPEIGAYLLSLWGFSDDLVECVLCHTEPERAEADGPAALTAVHAAACIARLCERAGEEGRAEPLHELIPVLLEDTDRDRIDPTGTMEDFARWLDVTEPCQTALRAA